MDQNPLNSSSFSPLHCIRCDYIAFY